MRRIKLRIYVEWYAQLIPPFRSHIRVTFCPTSHPYPYVHLSLEVVNQWKGGLNSLRDLLFVHIIS